MNEQWLVEGVLHSADRGIAATLLRLALTPLAWLHQIGLEIYLLPFHLGLRQRFRLPIPVISIGNLSSGGTGKTPATVLVAQMLQAQGKRVVILSRGHRGSGEKSSEPRIVSDGAKVLLTPDESGDEPALLAALLPTVPVIVCRDRRKSGRLAVEKFQPDVIVLDDGLQYWQLHRDLDIILLDARRPFDNGFVLPRGLLREPPYHLARAGVAILTRANRVGSVEALTEIQQKVAHYTGPRVPVLTANHAPVGWVDTAHPETTLPLDAFFGTPAFVFSGIADDAAFVETIKSLGADVVGSRSFGDHHEYVLPEIQNLAAEIGTAVVALTTEKDAVKVAPLAAQADLRVAALRIHLEVSDQETLGNILHSVT